MAVFWTAIIVYALISPPSETPRFPWLHAPGVDKLIHAVLFFAEAALLLNAWKTGLNFRSMTIVLLWCAFLGGGLEVVQYYFVDGRNGDWLDFFADLAGAFLAVIFMLQTRKTASRYGI